MSDDTEELKTLIMIVRDLVYIELLEDKQGHNAVLTEYLDTLNEMLGDKPYEP